MKIKKQQIEYLAQLARLDFSEQEKEKYIEQISIILEYFQKIDSVDTDKVKPLDFITELKNVWRIDEEKQIFSQKKCLAEAPKLKEGHVIVPQILDSRK